MNRRSVQRRGRSGPGVVAATRTRLVPRAVLAGLLGMLGLLVLLPAPSVLAAPPAGEVTYWFPMPPAEAYEFDLVREIHEAVEAVEDDIADSLDQERSAREEGRFLVLEDDYRLPHGLTHGVEITFDLSEDPALPRITGTDVRSGEHASTEGEAPADGAIPIEVSPAEDAEFGVHEEDRGLLHTIRGQRAEGEFRFQISLDPSAVRRQAQRLDVTWYYSIWDEDEVRLFSPAPGMSGHLGPRPADLPDDGVDDAEPTDELGQGPVEGQDQDPAGEGVPTPPATADGDSGTGQDAVIAAPAPSGLHEPGATAAAAGATAAAALAALAGAALSAGTAAGAGAAAAGGGAGAAAGGAGAAPVGDGGASRVPVEPRAGERMTYSDGKGYVWHLPVDDDATEPFWVPVDHYEEEQRLHEDGRVYEDGRWQEEAARSGAEAGQEEDVAESGGSSDPPLGERMTHTDGREYAWHLPVDDDATEPFWVPVDHYEEEQRLHEDGRVYEDGRWHADQDAVAEARRLEEIAEENERERQAHAQERDDARQVLRDYAEGRHVPLSVEELRQLPASEEEIALAEERRAELDAERMTQLEDDLRGLIFERRGEGYYVSNRDEWEQLLFHFGWPVDLGNDVMVPAYDLILGTERPEDAAGTCGDFLERGSEWLPPMLDEVFGDDYVMSAIGVESDRFSNHVANVVILPDGSRSVIDVWQGMAHPNEQFIFTEQEWLERWEGEVESRWAPTQHIDPGELGASDEEDRMWSFIDSGNGRERIEEEGLEEGLRYWIEATDDEDIRRERSIVVRNLLDHDTYRSSQYQP